MANVEFGKTKTFIVLGTVAACFAVLWPKIFYPMITSSNNKENFETGDGCCDVIFETDINAIKIMTEMCGTILNRQEEFDPKLSQTFLQGKLTKEVINTCRTEVLNICGIDIAEFLSKKDKIGHSYKQMLDEIRSFNISVCLRHHFGVNPGLLGAPRRMRVWGPSTSRHLRQERPLHFRPEMVHPALREKGRAIPQSQVAKDRGPHRSMPTPGSRPPMGGAGRVMPPPKVSGTMNILMPLYTIGIVIFFVYTLMKLVTRRMGGNNELNGFQSDPEFRRVAFSEDYSNGCAAHVEDRIPAKQEGLRLRKPTDDSTRLGWKERDTIMTAITGLLAEVDQQLKRERDTQTQYSTELKDKKILEEPCTEEEKIKKRKTLELSEQVEIINKDSLRAENGQAGVHRDLPEEVELDETKPKVKVVGLELMAECEGGQKWSRPATPNLGVGGSSRPTTPIPPLHSPEPQNIFLEGALPQQSQLLVTDSKTQALTLPDTDEPEPPVILSSKMTLSLISLDAALSEENQRQDQPLPQPQVDVKNDDDNFGSADSTLLDIDSEVIDETGHNEYESSEFQEQESGDLESDPASKQVNEITEDPSTNYTTATMSERAEAGLAPESEDTAADVSNLDNLDLTEDQENLQTENCQLWNGNAREVEELQNQESLEDSELQQQG